MFTNSMLTVLNLSFNPFRICAASLHIFFLLAPSRAVSWKQQLLLLQPHSLSVESAEELAIRSWSTSPHPPPSLRPSAPPSLHPGPGPCWRPWWMIHPPRKKELTHHCVSAPYFQSGQELNGFTNSFASSPARATFSFCCWICKIRKYSIKMYCNTWS